MIDEVLRALGAATPQEQTIEEWLRARRPGGEKLAKFCAYDESRGEHVWVSQDVVTISIDAVCLKCGAVVSYQPLRDLKREIPNL